MNKRLINFLFKIDNITEHWKALLIIRKAITILFPFILVGVYVELISEAVFHKHGFLNNIYHINQWLPGFKIFSRYFTILDLSINGVISIALTFLIAEITIQRTSRNELVAGVTAAFSFMIMNFNRGILGHTGNHETSWFLEGNLGYSGIFIAIIVGLVTGWIFNHFAVSNTDKGTGKEGHFEQRLSLATQINKTLKPALITLAFFGVLSCIVSFLIKLSANGLLSNPLEFSFTGYSLVLGSAILSLMLNNFIWLLGLIGYFDFNNINSSNMVQNLEYAIQHGSSWGAPNPISLHTLVDSFANIGGPGMALSLFIAIIWRSRDKDIQIIGKTSLLPSIFNVNQSPLVGIALLYDPLLIIPFICTPMVSIIITWSALKLNFMPPSVYPVSETTPGFLAGWLGTGGTWQAFLISIINLLAAVALYLPFVLLHNYFESMRKGGATNEV